MITEEMIEDYWLINYNPNKLTLFEKLYLESELQSRLVVITTAIGIIALEAMGYELDYSCITTFSNGVIFS